MFFTRTTLFRPRAVNWLDHSKTLREQNIDPNEVLLLRRKFFYSDQNVDARDPVQLNLLYVQVSAGGGELCHHVLRLYVSPCLSPLS